MEYRYRDAWAGYENVIDRESIKTLNDTTWLIVPRMYLKNQLALPEEPLIPNIYMIALNHP